MPLWLSAFLCFACLLLGYALGFEWGWEDCEEHLIACGYTVPEDDE